MASAQAEQVYKTGEEIVADILAAWQTRLPDMELGPDSIGRIWTEVFANTTEGLYLMAQLLHDDMFIQTMSALTLMRAGDMYGRARKDGTVALGTVRFAGAGGTYIPTGTQVASPRPSLDDTLVFATTVDGQIPNPGLTDPPVAADNGVGVMPAGTYEYGVTFVTAGGETDLGTPSNALVQVINKKINVTAIDLGGLGTTARKLYRRVNGGAWKLVPTGATLNDNVTTVYADNNLDAALGAAPPTESTAERVTLAATSIDTGTDYNVAIGAITDVMDAIGGLSEVTNAIAFSGGSDPEDVEIHRQELLKAVRAPGSGSLTDLEVWATSVDGIESATAFKNVNLAGAATPGTVALRVSGPDGAIPDAPKIAEVQALIDARDLAIITVEVGAFTQVSVAVTIDVTTEGTYTLADVTPSVNEAIKDYINSVPVDGTVYRAGILWAVFALPGIETAILPSLPAADVNLAATEKAIPGVITVS